MGSEIFEESKFVKLNISGTQFRCLKIDFARFPNTKLGRLVTAPDLESALAVAPCMLEITQEFYFHRSAEIFAIILDFYRLGEIHTPMNLCPNRIYVELEFWEIPSNCLADCCIPKRQKISANQLHLANGSIHSGTHDAARNSVFSLDQFNSISMEEQFRGKHCANIRRRAWNFLENPRSSHFAIV